MKIVLRQGRNLTKCRKSNGRLVAKPTAIYFELVLGHSRCPGEWTTSTYSLYLYGLAGRERDSSDVDAQLEQPVA